MPGGFMADPDVMDTWATSSLTPADRLRLGAGPRAVRADLPDGPEHPRARDHPHLAVLPGGAGALREPLAALGALDDQRLRDGSGPQEDEQVEGQRGRADRRAGPLRIRRRALAGGQGTAGPGLALRRERDEGRPPAGAEGAERQQVRAGHRQRSRTGSGHRSRWTGRCWPSSRPWSTRPRPPSTRTTTPARSR